MKRGLLASAVVAAAAVGFCFLGPVAAVTMMFNGGIDQAAAAISCGGSTSPAPGRIHVGNLDQEQMGNATTIVRVGKNFPAGGTVGGRPVPLPDRAFVVAIATAMQESKMRNVDYGDRDSLGLFQQRPSQGWGTPAQVLDPVYSSTQFYKHLVKVPGWQRMSINDAAQTVQRSATPSAYAAWESLAFAVVAKLAGSNAAGISPACARPGAVSSTGWVWPARGGIVSGFRTADRPGHDGTDIGAPAGSAIVAAAAGTVTVVVCNAHGGGAAQNACAAPGGMSVQGCGWYVEISHGLADTAGGQRNAVTRYCHMVTRPGVAVGQRVAAGDPLGNVGSTGNSSGPHLHFEVHLGGNDSASAVDPAAWMREHGVTIPT